MEIEVEAVLGKIRRIRLEKELSIIDLAAEAEISHSYLFYIESKRKVPTILIFQSERSARQAPSQDRLDLAEQTSREPADRLGLLRFNCSNLCAAHDRG